MLGLVMHESVASCNYDSFLHALVYIYHLWQECSLLSQNLSQMHCHVIITIIFTEAILNSAVTKSCLYQNSGLFYISSKSASCIYMICSLCDVMHKKQ